MSQNQKTHQNSSPVRSKAMNVSPPRLFQTAIAASSNNGSALQQFPITNEQSYSTIISDKITTLLTNARTASSKKDYQKAIQFLSKALYLKPNIAEAFLELAEMHLHLHDTTSALTYLKHANQLSYKAATETRIKDLLFQRGFLQLQQGEPCEILRNTIYSESFAPRMCFDLISFPKHQTLSQQQQLNPNQLEDTSKQQHLRQRTQQSEESGSASNETINRSPLLDSNYNERNSSAAWTHLLRAYCFLQTFHKSYALDEIEAGLKKDANWIELHLLKGKILWSQNLHADGNKSFWRAEQLNCEHEEVKEFLKLIIPKADELLKDTRYLLVQNQFDRCMANVKQGLNLFPNNTQFLLIQSFITRKANAYEDSLAILKLAYQTLRDKSLEFEIKNQFSLTYNEMGLLCLQSTQFDEAIALFNEALLYKPFDSLVLINRGDALRSLNRFDDALKDYLKAQKFQSASENSRELSLRISMMRHSRGIILFNQKKYEKALKEFTEAIKLNELISQYFFNRAKCYIVLKDTQAAVADFIKANQLDPSNLEIAAIIAKFKQDSSQKNTSKFYLPNLKIA